jgi:arylsulfatase A-like enzyme
MKTLPRPRFAVLLAESTTAKTAIALIVAMLLAPHTGLHAAEPSKPNIVVVLADDLGWGDTSPYGNTVVKTPNLEKLAAQGVKFNQCYAPCGVCSPSRSAILTGRTPYRNGVWAHLSGNHEAHLRTSEIAYPKLLKAIGYETCHVGKWHLNSRPQWNTSEFPQPGDHGYDYWMATHNNASPSHKNPDNFVRNGKPVGPLEGFSAQLVATEAIKWLNDIHDPSKPFVLSVWFHEPHAPIATDPQFSGLYPDHPNSKYLGNVTQMDNGLGMIMDALETRGLADNTLLFFTSDNGPEGKGGIRGGSTGGLRGRKRSDYEGGIRVPGIVRWPGHIKPGTVSDVPVVGSDIFATVLELTGVALPKDRTIDGVSMVPAFAGKPVERKVPLFWRTHVSPPGDRVAMRIGDWKIVGSDELTTFELYEIQKDWKEENNLAGKMPEKAAEMQAALLKLWKEIEAEGPKEWWLDKAGGKKGARELSY